MKNYGIHSLSPIPTIDIMATPSEKNKYKLKIKKRKRYNENEQNNSETKTKDFSYSSLSRNITNNSNMGYFYKSILNSQNNDKYFATTYYNAKFNQHINLGINKLINEKPPNIIFDYLTNSSKQYSNNITNNINISDNNNYNNNNISNNNNNYNNNNISNNNINNNIKNEILEFKSPIKKKQSKTLDLEALNLYYENLPNSNKTYSSNFYSLRNSERKNNYTMSNFKDSDFTKTVSTNLTSKGRRVSMKSVIDKIQDIEKLNSFRKNYSLSNNKVQKKRRKIYPEKRVSQFELVPKIRKKIIKNTLFRGTNKNYKNIDLIANKIVKSRDDPFKTYSLNENLLEMRTRLGNNIKKLVHESLQSDYNITNEQILFSLEKTKKSDYTKDIIEKIKIINNFLDDFPKEKFESDLLRHRKVFVIIDGTVVFNEEIIKGDFIDLPTRRYLSFLENKKERLNEYYKFLARCERTFRSIIPYKNIFLINGINIFDLIEIPESDNCLYVSASNIFRGIHLFWEDQIDVKNVKKKDFKLLKIQECKKAIIKFRKPKIDLKKIKKKKKFWQKLKKDYKIFKTYIKKKPYLNDNSFTFGLSDKILNGEEKFCYYSEDEEKKKKNLQNFKKNHPTLIQQLIFFNENDMKKRIEDSNKKSEKKTNKFLSKRVNEETFQGLNNLMRRYNDIRGKRYKIEIHQNMKSVLQKMEDDVKEGTKGIFSAYLNKLQILSKKDSEYEIDEDKFYDTEKNLEKKLQKSIIHKNIQKINDMAHHTIREIDKYYPDLISMNIPAVLKAYPKLKRRVFYDIFIQYKNLLTLCICVNKDLKKINKGLDFPTFFNCLPQMKSQGHLQAMKLYKTLNKLNTDYLNWEEFMQGMLSMKSNNISDKIDIFFNVIDADGNGLLSFDEVYEISKQSLQRTLGDKNDDDDEVVNCLATYFANLIFQLVDMPIDDEIPMDKIKEKILEGQSAAGYLEMFICADSFT